MTFMYADSDLSGNSSITEGFLKAQRWNATGGPLSSGGWDDPATFGSNTNNSGNNTVTVAGVYNYSPWVLHDGESSGNSPLPIELVDFKASCTNDVVTINWTTATEVNNDYFTVQRSTDLTNYTNVAVVEGAGNSNTLLNYSTKDQYPLTGTSYYRLMQTDYDGQFEMFSPVAVMCVTKDADVISVFPNPANDRLNVTMNLTANDRGRILIYNHFGQLVESLFVEPKAGVNTYSFDLNNLSQGQYMVSFMMEGKVLPTQKVIISR
ncbi:MAG: T9SS type A sorting domain-containing protein [Sphingobacteriales bacterium JAD_PAG50586_3]|nr:MAG: T9SS type A sorting domain-containing protein [Sphingobacteriales bacterium JAD_PAG50586_3]